MTDWEAVARSLTKACRVAGLPQHAMYVPPESPGMDGDIVFVCLDRAADIALQAGDAGIAMNRIVYENGEMIPVEMLRCFQPDDISGISAAVVEELRKA